MTTVMQSYAGDHLSSVRPLDFSVPQGSCADPLLYSVYASMLKYSIPGNTGIHSFADNNTLKDSFKPAVHDMNKIISLQECLWDVKIWMDANRLKMNDVKTEFLLCGSRQQIPKCITSLLMVKDITVEISQVIKYLSIWVDKTYLSNIKSLLSAKNLWQMLL